MINLLQISIILGFLYFLMLMLISLGLVYIPFTKRSADQLSVSVLISARNEAGIIGRLLESLTKLRYPENRYEIILIDDDSTDETSKIMHRYAEGKPNWRVLHHSKIGDDLKGKKGSITMGIRHSCGDIIMVTDADCIVPPDWLSSTVAFFRPEIGMVLGASPVAKGQGFFNIYLRFDSLCEASVAAATTFYNKPSHANARNMAFRKTVFEEVNGYSSETNIDTGDDFFLMQKIRTNTQWRFAYNVDPASFVLTAAMDFGKAFIHQQLRRNSKAFNLTIPFFLMGAVVFLFHVTIVVLAFTPMLWKWFCILLAFKFISEFIPTLYGARLLRQKDLLKYFPILWIVYPAIYLTSQVLGSLKFYRWK